MNVTLHLGDCREGLLELQCKQTAIITDSPYGIGFVPNNRHKVTQRRDVFPPIIGDDKPFDPSHLLRFETVVLWGANNFADRLPPRAGWLVWDKKNGTTSDDSSDCELAWTNRNGAVKMFSYLWRGIVKESQTRADENSYRLHPHQKPVALFKWVIEQMNLPKGTLIVDPYMGSGPCGVAAVELGYAFMGWEIDPQYFPIAERRIREAQMQLPLDLAV